MGKKSVKEIVCSVGMCSRPEFYLGRGARRSDLNGDKLYAIYQEIKDEFSQKKAEAFVAMVKRIQFLSATNFLKELYALEKNSWELKVEESENTTNYCGAEAIAFAAMVGVRSGKSFRDDTYLIKGEFLRKVRFGE
ncbi:MAG: hypothetical protein V8R81_06025 [Clostridia bacterium]